MENGKIENHIVKKLSNYESKVDAQGIWDSLELNTTNASKTNINNYRYLWLLLPLFLVGSMYLYSRTIQLTTTTDSNLSEAVSPMKNTVTTHSQSNTNTGLKETVSAATHQQAIDESQGHEITQEAEMLNQEAVSNSTQTTSVKSHSKKKISHEQARKNTEQVKQYTSQTQTSSSTNSFNSTAQGIDGNTTNESSYSTYQMDHSSSNVGGVQANDMKAAAITEIAEDRSELTASILRSTELNPLDFYTKNNFPRPVECPDFGGRKPLRFSVDIHAIPYYSNQLLSLLDTANNQPWLKQRQDTESALEAFQINVLGRMMTRSGLYVQGGIGYGQIDEKLNVPIQEQTSTSTEDGPIIVVIYGNGIPNDTIMGDVTVTTTNRKGAKTYNYHRMIEIPIAIGYEKRMKNWGFYIDGGASFNIWTNRKGYLLMNNEPTKYQDASVFTNSTGVKLNGSLGAKYYFKNNMSISFGPDVRYHLQNWMKPQYGMSQKYLDLGLRVGLSMPF